VYETRGGEIVPFPSQSVAVVNLGAADPVTDQVIISGVSGQRIVVLYGSLSTGSAGVTLLVESGGSTALTGVMPMPVWTIWPLDPPDGIMLWKCVAGQSLTFTKTGTGTLNGWLVYTMVQAQ